MSNKPTLDEIKRDIWTKYGKPGTMDEFLNDEDIQYQFTTLIAGIIGEETGYRNRSQKLQRQRAKEAGVDL